MTTIARNLLSRTRPMLWLAALLLALTAATAGAQPAVRVDSVLLWPEGAPGTVGDTRADRPMLYLYVPQAPRHNGTAVVVCPGGGYRHLAMGHEGRDIAAWLNERGIAAFVLRYRLGPRYRHPAPLQDVQRALQWVRHHAPNYDVDPARVGVWGFSAGGHLAATAATHFGPGTPDAADVLERQSTRPDFAILSYPVITFTEAYTHEGSRRALLGDAPDPELVASLSNENSVTAETPPTFLFHTTEDQGVPPENSIAFYLALREAGVPAELHIYERGRHGVGLAPDDPVLSTWSDRLHDWLKARELIRPPR